jgi:NADPH-dependent glutamate synthase beta subunit-like oxidoreductase/2,4-dienoyl-CoA reductase-like NADH-dependent reductase (Old Yellow Enzyme family)
MKYPRLFSPLKIRDCEIPNRIMSTAAVTRLAAEDGHVTAAITARYQRMAKGGLGAMVVEAAVVLPSRSSYNFRVSDDQFIGELKAFAEAIRKVNPSVKIGLQIMHFLKVARSGWRQKVEDLKPEEIEVIPDQFASGALRAKSAGFDFVEIHMAHFTTLASFLSLVNKREDDYGGDFEGRIKLPTEVVLAVRKSVGDYPVGIRMNGEEFTKEGNTLVQSIRVAKRVAKLGVDYISVSAGERFEDAPPPPEGFPPFAGTGYSGYRMSPRWWSPDGVQVYLAEGIRKSLREAGYDIPVVTAGKIRMPDLAEQILQQDRADIIGMARTLLCDPDWPIKSQEGRDDEIVKCAACGFCSESDERYEKVTCIQWPEGAINAPSPWLLVPPCKAACPAGLDIRGYLELITQGQYEDALQLIEEKVPLPATVGRVCPRFCEEKCNRSNLDEAPIAINALKRFVADAVKARNKKATPPSVAAKKSEQVAIVGSGPAGLSAAFYLSKLGYGTTIFEANGIAGGMLALGIPEFRLPREILQSEIANIKKFGIEIKLNCPVGKDGLSLSSLREQGYKAIFLAVGAQKSVSMDIPNVNSEGVVDGALWLKEVNVGKKVKVGKNVVVVGGGNVAMDAARTALRLGATKVSVIYRRSKEEIPAIKDEIEEAEKEGIKIHYLTTPGQIIGEGKKYKGIECVRTELGELDESGRRRPIVVKGTEFLLEADMVIAAIGQEPDLSFVEPEELEISAHKTLKVDPHTLSTNVEGIFAGGDVVSGPATVIEAIADGRKAAIAIDKYLCGENLKESLTPDTIRFETIDLKMFKKRTRQSMPCLSPGERMPGFKEVELGFHELAALAEADRCFQCGMFPKKEKATENKSGQ